MTSFSDVFPDALHVIPLHAWKSIARSGTLLSKKQSANAGTPMERASSGPVDRALGFDDFVHFYLSKSGTPDDAPILQSQLGPTRRPPFPHVVIRISTRDLSDEDCTVCCWNVARSNPKLDDSGFGTWVKGETPDQIREKWEAYRNSKPPLHRRRGDWEPGLSVPVFIGPRIKENLGIVRSDGKELLFRSRFQLPSSAQLWSLSRWDSESLKLLPRAPYRLFGNREIKGYTNTPKDPVHPAVRRAIDDYFRDPDPDRPIPNLDFDIRRTG
jgi:hypothetical protein